MPMRDATLDLNVVHSIDPAVITSDTNGAAVDLADYHAATVAFTFGESGDTLSGSVYAEGRIEESADGSTGWTAVADADLRGTEPTVDDAAEDDATYLVGYVGSERYIRAVIDVTGTHTNGTPIAATVIRERARTTGGSVV